MMVLDLHQPLTDDERRRLARAQRWFIGPDLYFDIRLGQWSADSELGRFAHLTLQRSIELTVDRYLEGWWLVALEADDQTTLLVRPVGEVGLGPDLYAIAPDDDRLVAHKLLFGVALKPVDSGG